MQSCRRKSLWLALLASWLLGLLGILPLLRLAVPTGPRAGAPQGWPRWLDAELLQSFLQPGELPEDAPQLRRAPRGGSCDWGACFDTSKCRSGGFKVFVYPAAEPTSEMQHKILASIEGSRYHTVSPTEACLHLLTLDAPAGACSLVPPKWNGGKNHLVLRLHPASCSGTFQLGWAMVAEASPTVDTFRPGFDVALPLLPEAHPVRGGAPGQLRQHSPHPGAALLALAEERGGWRVAATDSSACPWDGHCEQDHGPEQTHPGAALPNATFCLIPGRRADALRFLQALQAGCIPVLLSPRWELPFSEVIDWTKAAIVADKRLPLQVLAALQEMPPTRVLALRQQTQFLWDTYFSSVEKVIRTALESLRSFCRSFRTGSSEHPLTHRCCGTAPQGHSWPCPRSPRVPWTSPSITYSRILVLWSNDKPPPPSWPETAVPLLVIEGHRKVSARFFPHSAISTDAILSLDAHSSLSTSEVDFAFVVWQSFPERMVGFLTWSHFWDEAQGRWGYTAERVNEFSMVLTSAAFYHRYYHTLFTHSLPKALRRLAEAAPHCVDVLMNFLVAAATKLPPIKVPSGRRHEDASPPRVPGDLGPAARDCIDRVAAGFGHMPLVSSRLRLDPVLFKDPVSVLRKKYRGLEKP
ncbi:exostosin-like 1 isoform X3 [Myotis myotis]|uniref:exostosin-like 1 isoform X3 n=1 Tax=Myotis myotis TaxID=51298 RepID=UPI00174D48B3|nr:exostosin-like 1 isoform X3 [Myotis myotis]